MFSPVNVPILLAKKIGINVGSCGIVTGEYMGQVSSQTPENLMAIEDGLNFPVYRPIIAWDKDDTTELARRIGTFTGENMGQVSSQTPENLMAIEDGLNFPVYRPIIAWDKDDTTELARRYIARLNSTFGMVYFPVRVNSSMSGEQSIMCILASYPCPQSS